MMDWADEIERSIAESYSSLGEYLAGYDDGKIAAALRKAKADGMREAADLTLQGFGHRGTLFEAAHQIRIRANQIEKGE